MRLEIKYVLLLTWLLLLLLLLLKIKYLPNVSNLVEKTYYNEKISEIEINISNFLKETDFDSKLKNVTSNENELNELSKKVKSISKKD